MIEIFPAVETDLPLIRHLAQQIWPSTFKGILSEQQIDYMLEMMYSLDALKSQIQDKNHIFLLAREKERGHYLGFVSYETGYQGTPTTKIHKIYLLPASQGKGIGRQLLNEVTEAARVAGNTVLSLNVNCHNTAIRFYKKMGFRHVKSEKIDIGQGYVMDDFVMEKPLVV